METGTKTLLDALTLRPEHQAMLTALIIISLLSLLIATEAETAGSPVDLAPEPPSRPKPKARSDKRDEAERLAA